MARAKDASSLLTQDPYDTAALNDAIMTAFKPPEAPVNRAIDILSSEQGPALELNTRANRFVTEAITRTHIYSYRFKIPYFEERSGRLMRLAVSSGGEGRRDIVEAVRAGGPVTDAYYNQGNAKPSAIPLRHND